MRTKTLLMTAVLGVAGTAAAMAQVYSVNAVGYVNVTLVSQPNLDTFNLISNPLDAGDNSIAKIFKGVPAGAIVYTFDPTKGYDINGFDGTVWDSDTMAVAPGQGAFVLMPAGKPNATVTFVGEVVQGKGDQAPTLNLAGGNPPDGIFNLVSSKVPIEGKLSTAIANGGLAYPAATGDLIYPYDPINGYATIYSYDGSVWDPEEPTIKVGQGFWALRTTPGTWKQEFSVNP